MRHLLAVALAVMLALPVAAEDFEKGREAYGRGDYAAALREWRPLAEQGDARAQHKLGLMYEYGRGLRQNDVEAVKWYGKAALQGLAAAQYKLGIMYDNSWGVPQNDVEAVKWYKLAAAQGHAYAQFDLGLMYAFGTGVLQDYVRAHMWLDLAGTRDNKYMVNFRNEIAQNMTPAQLAEARRMAREWLETHGKTK